MFNHWVLLLYDILLIDMYIYIHIYIYIIYIIHVIYIKISSSPKRWQNILFSQSAIPNFPIVFTLLWEIVILYLGNKNYSKELFWDAVDMVVMELMFGVLRCKAFRRVQEQSLIGSIDKAELTNKFPFVTDTDLYKPLIWVPKLIKLMHPQSIKPYQNCFRIVAVK